LSIEVREARPSDREPLMSFIKNVWGGHDYIPRVWDQWLKEKDSKMFVVLVDGRPVGMSRVCFLEDGSAWFEGARVHPEFRGRGLATALGERMMRVSREKGVKVFRLTSSSRNKRAHRQIRRMGFEETSRLSVYAPVEGMAPGHTGGVRRAGEDQIAEVMSVIRSSREFAIGSGVLWDEFTAEALDQKIVANALAIGHVYRTQNALAVAKTVKAGNEVWKQVCFLTGKGEEAVRIVRHFFLQGEKADWCIAYVPQGSRLIGALRRAGLKRDISLTLFQRKAVNG
jgi:GNAT superfamily N-acetyltransferase